MSSQRYFQDLGDRTGCAGPAAEPPGGKIENKRNQSIPIAFAIACTMVISTGWVTSRDVRELASEGIGSRARIVAPTDSQATTVAAPSKIGAGSAIPLPGFDQIGNAFSPALSPDMRTIIFAQYLDNLTGYDLYIATRASVDDPFETPSLITGCQSAECDAYPTLSPDRLELVFVRSDDDPQLMRSVRPTINDEFGAAERCGTVCHAESGESVTTPQLIAGGSQLFYGCRRLDPIGRRVAIARRNSDDQFEPAFPVLSTHTLPMLFLSTDLLRAYCGGPGGIHRAVRQSPSHSFGNNSIWADSTLTGDVEGPLWVSPHEDAVVYCSGGPGKKPGEARRLWLWKPAASEGAISVGRD